MAVAVFGASGYQGGLVLAELRRRGLRPLLVGRSAARLREAARRADLPETVRVADTADEEALAHAFADARAVIDCAGPFARLGPPVLRAALAAGCHYTDTSGEQRHVRWVLDAMDDAARRAGVTAVPAATDGCLLPDLAARLLSDRLGPLDSLFITHVVEGGTSSRGSLRSLVEGMDDIRSGGVSYRDGAWTEAAPEPAEVLLPDGAAVRTARFPLPEVVTIPRATPVRNLTAVVDADLRSRLSAAPPPAESIAALPDGPDPGARAAQRFTYLLDALATSGARARVTLRGRDTYGTTAVTAVETAVRLLAAPPLPGALTASQALRPGSFLASLSAHGVDHAVSAPAPV
ncbi:saccharopine dehydrogenase NADP-binding domain-containing protein [Actinomadura flavalba]|uniref:saccharopine dehydrogenase NADP-binding domain-containing protein n=1 Tax=Actinomadura flavalba TaxID=1120938 RepID=UPI00036C0C09|nr:saccharopine dehydrogenase NADP-binding domain-containing protein [Actinomadura flavalba]